MKNYILYFILVVLINTSLFALERRREQFSNASNYLILPVPYSIPGIGTGWMLTGYAGNIAGSYTDIFATKIIGDVEGDIYALREMYLIHKRLFFEAFHGRFTTAASSSYRERGMESDQDERDIVELSNIQFRGASINLSFWKRRLEFIYQYADGFATFDKIRDKDGELIADNINNRTDFLRHIYQLKLDYTDDFQDPRKGLRLEVIRENIEIEEQDIKSPEQYTMDYNLSFYFPIGKISTWVFNYYQSDAIVAKEGETDPAKIASQINIDCSSSSDQQKCEQAKQTQVDNTIAQNKYGTASNMGGATRLRGYEQNRFRAAHHRFYGTEFRWNLSDELSPFDLFFMKDIRTGIQIAGFYETATSADKRSNLGKTWKSDYGGGLRIITRSGFVYRFEFARGDEGNKFVAFFNYPWEGW